MQVEQSENKAVTRNRLNSDPSTTLVKPLEIFRKPYFRRIKRLSAKMVMTDVEIQTLVERRVPIFYGQHDVDSSEVHYFIDACTTISQRDDFANVDQMVTLLEEIKLRLRGKAYTIMRDAKVKTLKELLKIITNKFLPSHSIESLSNRLYTASQGASEDCSEFGARVQGYALDYEAGVRAKLGEDNLLPKLFLETLERDAFIRGLNNGIIRAHLTMISETPIRELIVMADKLERQLGYAKDLNKVNGFSKQKCQICDKIGHIAKDCYKFKTASKQPTQQIEICQFCGKTGHVARSCPENNQKQKAQFCSYCKRPGHSMEECRTRRGNYTRNTTFQPREMPNEYQPAYRSGQRGFGQGPNTNQNYQPGNPMSNSQREVHTQRNLTSGYPVKTQTRRNSGVEQINQDLGKLRINYIEDNEIREEPVVQQGNEHGLVEQQPHQL